MWGSGFSSSLLLLCLVDPRTVFVLDLFLLSGPTPATLVKLDTVLFPGLGYLETIFKGPGSLTNYFEFVLHVINFLGKYKKMYILVPELSIASGQLVSLI